jgi:hypothetical protein
VGIVGLRYVIAYLNSRGEDRLEKAARTTGMWLAMIATGVAGAVAIGLVQLGDIVGMLTQFVGGHPFIVSNLAGIGIGAGALTGLFDLSADQYVGVAMAIVGAVFLISEVTDANAR